MSRPASGALLRAVTRKHRSLPTARSLTTANAVSWQPAVPSGSIPAYDAALELLSQHKAERESHIASIRKQLSDLPSDAPERSALQLEISGAEINGAINDPAVRWQFERMVREEENGEGGSKLRENPVYRQLAEQRWRMNGGMDLLVSKRRKMDGFAGHY
jgi:hypothetical protein